MLVGHSRDIGIQCLGHEVGLSSRLLEARALRLLEELLILAKVEQIPPLMGLFSILFCC